MRLSFAPVLALPVLLAACALPGREAPPPAEPEVAVVVGPAPEVLRPRPRPVAGEPTPAPTPVRGLLGQTLAGLGPPGEPGLWLRTGLVDRVRPGRVVSAAGVSQAVELRPSGAAAGAGSHLSLAAMRALGLNLAQLATVQVYAD